ASALTAAEGDDEKADDLLAAGLEIGARHGIVPFDWVSRPTLADRCRRARARGIQLEHVKDLAQKYVLDLGFHPPPPKDLVPIDFRQEVRSALRHLYETHRLAKSPLLSSSFVARRGSALDDRVATVREILLSVIAELARNPRTQMMHRALLFSFVEP